MPSRIDELNILRSEVKTISKRRKLQNYFNVMVLEEMQLARRIDIAGELIELNELMYSRFKSLQGTAIDEDIEDYLFTFYTNRALDIADKYDIDVDKTTVDKFAEQIVHTTVSNDGEWYTSSDRAFANAVDLSNLIENENDYKKAVSEGYTRKQWHTMMDERVRDTHSVLEGTTVGINDTFNVGGYQMRWPMDGAFDASASEIAGCRCSIEYL